MFTNMVTTVCRYYLHSVPLIKGTHPQPNSLPSTLLLSSHLRLNLPSGPFPTGALINIQYSAVSTP